ncbi:MAG TPA: DegV family protein [Clostridiales bacterium]|jgi:DegV family protein with EDD domain|nr:DegV family protein [Clostridiales bacterium]
MNVEILVDSASDLPKEIIEKYKLDPIAIPVILEEETFFDGKTITPEKLFEDMKKGVVYKTSQVPPNQYLERFRQLDENKQYLYVCFSSGLTKMFETSNIALEMIKEEKDLDLVIIDTKCASMGYGLVALEALKAAEEGKTREEIIDIVKDKADKMQHVFTVDNLDYLFRGGRLNKSSAVIGNMLSIKPVLQVDDEGKLYSYKKVRGNKKLFVEIIETIKENQIDIENQTVGITHASDMEKVEKIEELMMEELGVKSFMVSSMGCAIGAHTGPGAISIFFLGKKMGRFEE